MYAAISADQAVNLAPPDSPSPFLISNSPRSGAAQRLRRRLRSPAEEERRGGAGAARQRGEEEGREGKHPPKRLFSITQLPN